MAEARREDGIPVTEPALALPRPFVDKPARPGRGV